MNDGGPTRLGRFEIIETLGVGGFATVYRAYDPTFDTEVAIKVLAEAWSVMPDTRGRFADEARLMRKRASGELIAVYEMLEVDGRPVIVMELCGRGALDRRLEGLVRSVTLEEALGLATAIANATARLHRAGVVHRDIKPSNLLLRVRKPGSTHVPIGDLIGADEELVLGDFGLAKVFDPDDTRLTLGGGTPGWAAPEQFQGGPISPAADVYAASAVLVAALTASRPAAGQPRPFAPDVLAATGPLQLELERGLAADPADRHPDIEHWCRAVMSAGEDGFGLKPAVTTAIGREHRNRRSRWIKPTIGALAAIGLVGAGSALLLGEGWLGTGDDGDAPFSSTTLSEVSGSSAGQGADPVSDTTSPNGDEAGSPTEQREIGLDELAVGEVATDELVRFDFSVDPGGVVFLDSWVEEGSCGRRGDPRMSWQLRDAATNSVVHSAYTSHDDGCSDADAGPIDLTQGGPFHLYLYYGDPCLDCRGRYSFMVRTVPPPERFAINVGQAVTPELAPGAATIEAPGAVDLYELPVTAGERLAIDHFVADRRCEDGDRGLALIVANPADEEVPYWDAAVSELADCSHYDVGPFLIDETGVLTLRYSYPGGHDGVGAYSFVVERVDDEG